MKIRIENENARFACSDKMSDDGEIQKSKVVLDMQLEKQLWDRWCWASIASCVGRYYQTADWDQLEIACKVLKRDCSQITKDKINQSLYNKTCTLDKALDLVKCYSHWSLGKPTFERVQHEIRNNRPVCFRIEWHSGGAHYALIKGYNIATGRVYIEDSLHGSSRQLFSSFPRVYITFGGVWTDTFWIKDMVNKK